MTTRQNLSVYRLRELIDGEKADFKNVMRETKSLKSLDPANASDLDFQAKLFLSISKLQEPAWAEFLGDAFEKLDVPKIRRVDAVLLVQVAVEENDHLFAFTFGHGRHLLKPSAIDRSYGLQVALNVIYEEYDEKHENEASRVRSVDSKTVADDTFNTRRQADRRTAFEAFDVDINRDFLRAIVGRPKEAAFWGTRVSGGDSLSTNPALEFKDLGSFCRSIISAHTQDTYKEQFGWIDNLKAVTDPVLLAELYDAALKNVGDEITLAVPDLIEWDDVADFRFSFDQKSKFADPEDADLPKILAASKKPRQLDLEKAKKWKLEAVSAEGVLLHSWSIARCLAGQIQHKGHTYVLSEGEFFLVNPGYLAELDRFISAIPEASFDLPESIGDKKEGDYNELAASGSDDYLLLDKRTVRVENKTSAIEICDILTSGGAFIHVKRKLGSSDLSHLFAQGTVSADLLLMSPEYRNKTSDMIIAAENDRAEATGDGDFGGRFPRFGAGAIQPRDYEIVYAVVAKWKNRPPSVALPFFSKVNLRRHANDLKRRGFPVSFARVEVT